MTNFHFFTNLSFCKLLMKFPFYRVSILSGVYCRVGKWWNVSRCVHQDNARSQNRSWSAVVHNYPTWFVCVPNKTKKHTFLRAQNLTKFDLLSNLIFARYYWEFVKSDNLGQKNHVIPSDFLELALHIAFNCSQNDYKCSALFSSIKC